jgi:hypothetical protein
MPISKRNLLVKSGRRLVPTEVGRVVYRYADEIVSFGRDLTDVLWQRLGTRPLRLVVGMDDAAKAVANSIAPFYGQPAADAFLKLLAGHWGAVRDFNTATVAKSKSGQDKAVANLTSNAHDVAKFLSGANPYLPDKCGVWSAGRAWWASRGPEQPDRVR